MQGKTGMDAVVYLQTARGVRADDIVWVMPNDAWITARENIASCMEFLHTCVKVGKEKVAVEGLRCVHLPVVNGDRSPVRKRRLLPCLRCFLVA